MSYVNQLLGENEEVLLVARQSWVVLVRQALMNLLIALVAIGITLLILSVPNPIQTYGWLFSLLLLIPAARFALQFVDWVNRSYVVTNRRVIQVEGTFNKHVIDSSLEKVNDVRMSQSVLGRLLNYGDIEILTASELGSNSFQRIADPIRFKTVMLNAKEKLGFNDVPDAAGVPTPKSADIPALIASLSALKSEGMISEEEFQKKKAELLARM
jgi:uncharacterized membrane protein YdbT with pleckstrin-like domain